MDPFQTGGPAPPPPPMPSGRPPPRGRRPGRIVSRRSPPRHNPPQPVSRPVPSAATTRPSAPAPGRSTHSLPPSQSGATRPRLPGRTAGNGRSFVSHGVTPGDANGRSSHQAVRTTRLGAQSLAAAQVSREPALAPQPASSGQPATSQGPDVLISGSPSSSGECSSPGAVPSMYSGISMVAPPETVESSTSKQDRTSTTHQRTTSGSSLTLYARDLGVDSEYLSLNLDQNSVTRLAESAGDKVPLKSLEYLALRVDTQRTSIGALRSLLPSLTLLNLNGSVISKMRSLSPFSGVTALWLAGCGLSCLDGLELLSGLRELHVPCNNIRELEPLYDHASLEVLDCSFNPLDDPAEQLDWAATINTLSTMVLFTRRGGSTPAVSIAEVNARIPQLMWFNGESIMRFLRAKNSGDSESGFKMDASLTPPSPPKVSSSSEQSESDGMGTYLQTYYTHFYRRLYRPWAATEGDVERRYAELCVHPDSQTDSVPGNGERVFRLETPGSSSREVKRRARPSSACGRRPTFGVNQAPASPPEVPESIARPVERAPPADGPFSSRPAVKDGGSGGLSGPPAPGMVLGAKGGLLSRSTRPVAPLLPESPDENKQHVLHIPAVRNAIRGGRLHALRAGGRTRGLAPVRAVGALRKEPTSRHERTGSNGGVLMMTKSRKTSSVDQSLLQQYQRPTSAQARALAGRGPAPPSKLVTRDIKTNHEPSAMRNVDRARAGASVRGDFDLNPQIGGARGGVRRVRGGRVLNRTSGVATPRAKRASR